MDPFVEPIRVPFAPICAVIDFSQWYRQRTRHGLKFVSTAATTTRSSPQPASDMLSSHPSPLGLCSFDFHDLAMAEPSISFADAYATHESTDQNQILALGELEPESFLGVYPQSWVNSIDPALISINQSLHGGLLDITTSPPLLDPSDHVTNEVLRIFESNQTCAFGERLHQSNDEPGAEDDVIEQKRTARRRLKPHDWDIYKALIKRLYMHDDKSLKVTRQILKDDFGFEASYVPIEFPCYYHH